MTRKHSEAEAAPDLARQIVAEIEDDLRARHGIGSVWNSIDPDTQQGIRDRWVELVGGLLGKG